MENKTIYDLKVGDYVTAAKDCLGKDGKYLTKNKKYIVLTKDYIKYLNEYLIGIIDDLGGRTGFIADYFLDLIDVDTYKEHFIFSENYFSNPNENNIKTGIENKTGLENKPHLCCFDPHLEYEMGMGMRAGANKHGWNNHRNLTSDSAQQILDSLKRHLNAFLRDEEKDAETDTSHLACVGNNLNFLYRMTKQDGYEKVLENIYGEKR